MKNEPPKYLLRFNVNNEKEKDKVYLGVLFFTDLPSATKTDKRFISLLFTCNCRIRISDLMWYSIMAKRIAEENITTVENLWNIFDFFTFDTITLMSTFHSIKFPAFFDGLRSTDRSMSPWPSIVIFVAIDHRETLCIDQSRRKTRCGLV